MKPCTYYIAMKPSQFDKPQNYIPIVHKSLAIITMTTNLLFKYA